MPTAPGLIVAIYSLVVAAHSRKVRKLFLHLSVRKCERGGRYKVYKNRQPPARYGVIKCEERGVIRGSC